MIYTDLTRKAMKLAYEAHHGQTDKSDVPYIFHPYHLAEQMKDEISACTALLHDVAEDTDITVVDLEKDFPPAVTEALKLLTHSKDTDYMDYILKIKENPVAKAVKLADLKHNSDASRLEAQNGNDLCEASLRMEKYRLAIDVLSAAD